MIKMRTHIYLLLIFIIVACQVKDKECKESEKFLIEFSKGVSEKLPPPNSNLFMFFKLDDNSIIKINNISLYDVYKRGYKDKFKFNDFLCSLFNEKIYLKRNLLEQGSKNYVIIKPDKNIDLLKSKELIEKYCEKLDNYHRLKNQFNNDEKITILYTFFRNKKYVSFDDYQGYYIIKDSLR
ncbi:hypothetical protein BZL53_13345 [Flavobacterium columnare]|nr:hypothetical protein [Flavobacterium columnare]AUX19141.1 hypothetical protein AQ623_13260 [Flavobacterium columnare]MEB3802166.1 hypothetical protein [Flavobacterium columnare]OOB81729.1 hypothetical protein BZL53_13345 [Flavobacterium columnare]PTD16588.1 hypothetical protein C6N29_03005 [Flavobacterium columnare]